MLYKKYDSYSDLKNFKFSGKKLHTSWTENETAIILTVVPF